MCLFFAYLSYLFKLAKGTGLLRKLFHFFQHHEKRTNKLSRLQAMNEKTTFGVKIQYK